MTRLFYYEATVEGLHGKGWSAPARVIRIYAINIKEAKKKIVLSVNKDTPFTIVPLPDAMAEKDWAEHAEGIDKTLARLGISEDELKQRWHSEKGMSD